MKKPKYTREKVLFLANQSMFNVSLKEAKGTTLSELIPKLIKQNLLIIHSVTDTDTWYKTTPDGDIELLRLQIQTRKGLNKDVTDHVAEYEFLKLQRQEAK